MTLLPWISKICPFINGFAISWATPLVSVDIGVIIICLKRSVLGAMFVSRPCLSRRFKGGVSPGGAILSDHAFLFGVDIRITEGAMAFI